MAKTWEIIGMGIWNMLALTDGRIYLIKALHSSKLVSYAFISANQS